MSDRIDMRATRVTEETIGGRVYRLIAPPPKTPAPLDVWAEAMAAAYCEIGAEVPPKRGLAVMRAQFDLETARGERCYGHNYPNVMRVEGDACDWMELRTFEYIDPDGAGPRRVERVDTLATFRCFPDHFEGARRYLEFLRRPRYADALALAEKGEASAFARLLGARGFYTAPVPEYEAAIVSLMREELARLDGHEPLECVAIRPGLYPVELEPIPHSAAATPLRAGPGEHTVRIDAPSFDD